MEALVDTNVILTYLTGRDAPDAADCARVIELCAVGSIKGSIAFHSLSNIWYILHRTEFRDKRRRLLTDIVKILDVTGASPEKVREAIAWDDFHDFEDCLQYECAKEAGAAYIITANVKDFRAVQDVKIITPGEAIQLLARNPGEFLRENGDRK